MENEQTDVPADDLKWSVICTESEGVTLKFGVAMSESPLPDRAKLMALGRILIDLGTRLQTSVPAVEEDDYDDGYDWEGED